MKSIWKFPYLYKIKKYPPGRFYKIEKTILGLKTIAWDIVSFYVWEEFENGKRELS